MRFVDIIKGLFGIEQKKSRMKPVTDSDLSQALNALSALEGRVFKEAPKGKNEFAKIIKQLVEIQLKLREFREPQQIGVPVAKAGNEIKPGIDERVNLAKAEIKLNEFRGAVRGLLLNIGIQIKAFENQSKPLAQAMRDAVRYVMNKIAAEINMPKEYIKLAQSQGYWF